MRNRRKKRSKYPIKRGVAVDLSSECLNPLPIMKKLSFGYEYKKHLPKTVIC